MAFAALAFAGPTFAGLTFAGAAFPAPTFVGPAFAGTLTLDFAGADLATRDVVLLVVAGPALVGAFFAAVFAVVFAVAFVVAFTATFAGGAFRVAAGFTDGGGATEADTSLVLRRRVVVAAPLTRRRARPILVTAVINTLSPGGTDAHTTTQSTQCSRESCQDMSHRNHSASTQSIYDLSIVTESDNPGALSSRTDG